MEKSFNTNTAAAADKSQQDEVQMFCDFSNPEVLIQVSQLVNWVNTYAVYQSKGDPTTKTFMDGYSLIQGLQAQLESSQKSNATRNVQVSSANQAKSALEQENERLRQQLREQSAQVEKFKKRNSKLENHEKKIAIREVMPLGKLKCKVANLQLTFDTLVSKLEKEPLNKEDALSVQRKEELGEFRRDVGDLFGRVKHNMTKWEKNQKEMVGKLERTRVGLNSLNETVMPTPQHVNLADLQMNPTISPQATLPSTSTAIQSTGNMQFESTNQPQKISAVKPENREVLSGISVKTALSKHIKSRNIRKSNENIQQSEASTFTSIPAFSGRSNLEQILPIPTTSNACTVSIPPTPNDAGENLGSPQKPKSPIVCGLCGSGFSTLVQLKLHHAVFHSESTGGPAAGHEFLNEPLPSQRNRPQHLPQPNEAVQLAQYFSAQQANQGASTSAAANMEQYLMQYLLDLAAGISIPPPQNLDSFSGHENDRC